MALAIVRHPAGVAALVRQHARVNSLPDVTRPAIRSAASDAAAAIVRHSRALPAWFHRTSRSLHISLDASFDNLLRRASGLSGPRMLAFRFVQPPLHEALFIPARSCSSALRDRRPW